METVMKSKRIKNDDFILEIINNDTIIIKDIDTYDMVDYLNRHQDKNTLIKKLNKYGFSLN